MPPWHFMHIMTWTSFHSSMSWLLTMQAFTDQRLLRLPYLTPINQDSAQLVLGDTGQITFGTRHPG